MVGDQDEVDASQGVCGGQVKPPGPVQDLGFHAREDVDAGKLAQRLHGLHEVRHPGGIPPHMVDQAERAQPALASNADFSVTVLTPSENTEWTW